MICVPAPSAFALAAARLGWSQQDCALITLHGRPLEAIIPHLQPGARILALSWDDATPAKLAALIAARGMGRSKLTVCEAMGGPSERVRATEAQGFTLDNVAALNTIALEVVVDRGARVVPRAAGLPDDWLEHDGQITKREIRAITLAELAPRRGELLWDVGSGSGSVAIEWMLADPANGAVAVEARHDRAARIARNALTFGVPHLSVVAGEAPQVLADLPAPDAIFIGGGASAPDMIERAVGALAPGGRLVVNAVTLVTQAACVDWRARHGGELAQIAVAHAEPIGRFSGWRAAMPVVQWRLVKP
jgi:precorrin-6Y C5,15-methyltransferase (decarboxylating)